MRVLGIETSCDECAMAIVDDGHVLVHQKIYSQIEKHKAYYGVVPELAAREHVRSIAHIYQTLLAESEISASSIDAIAVSVEPGLAGSLLVGVSFAQALAWGLDIPLTGVNHVYAHAYAAHLEYDIAYPYIAVIVSGGHTLFARIDEPLHFHVYGSTLDDACGEAFDKVAKYYDMGYPGGPIIDTLAQYGNDSAFNFPIARLSKTEHRYDVSFSGLKNAVINQRNQFWDARSIQNNENIAASFQRAAIESITRVVRLLIADTQIARIVLGGGVAANSLLRATMHTCTSDLFIPSHILCTDNAAMIAGIGYHYICAGKTQLQQKITTKFYI